MKRRKGKRIRWALLVLCGSLGSILLYGAMRMRSVFMEYAINVCEDSAIGEIINLMEEEVFSDAALCERLVTLEYDSNRRVTALRTDAAAIGQVKTRVIRGLYERLGDLESALIEVPLGSVFLPRYCSGMGPRIDVGMAGLAQMEAEFSSAFSAAGINQTRHTLWIEISAGFRILTPVGGHDMAIVTRFPVTDTVLVGVVPERYVQIGEQSGDHLGEIALDPQENTEDDGAPRPTPLQWE